MEAPYRPLLLVLLSLLFSNRVSEPVTYVTYIPSVPIQPTALYHSCFSSIQTLLT